MKRKISTFLLAALMIFNVSAVHAGQITGWLRLGYWPGETYRTVTAGDLIATDRATVSGDSVTIDAGGSATWGFYIPYGSRSVTINHEGTAHIEMTSGDITYEFDLTGVNDGTANLLVFGDNLGRAAQGRSWTPDPYMGYKKEWVESQGEKEITITADSEVTINSLVFEKEMLPGPTPTKIDGELLDIAVTPDISEYDKETISTVLMDTEASIIIVNGGRRYIDNNDTDLLPYQYKGSVYLPINTLAKALGYYYEEDSSRGYALMRSSTHEVVLLDGECTVQEGYGAKVSAPDDAIIYREGYALAGVRYFAELAGNTVGYKDGLIAIDNKYTVEDILNESEFYGYIVAKFSDFKADKTEGNTYYVAQTSNADDNNAGTVSSPLKTLAEAAERAKAGDTVIVKEGVYRETLTPQNSGTATAPITFKAEGENVVISAADVLEAPVKSDETHASGYDVYVTDLPETLGIGRDQIFINGELMTQARYPNGPNLLEDGSMSNAWPVKGNIYLVAGTTDTIKSDSLLNQGDGYWDGAIWTGTFGYNYSHVGGVVESSSYGKLELDAEYFPHWWWSSWTDRVTTQGAGNSLNYGCLIGHENALDIPGEWVRTADDKLRIILPDDESPETVQIEAKTRQLVVDLNDKEYINVEGFKTIGGSVTMNDSEMCMLNDMDMKYIAHYTLSADQRSGYIDFPYDRSNQEGAPQRGEVGLYIDGTDNIIVNSTIDHSAGCALYLTGTYTYIENNIINDCGYTSSYTSGIHTDTQAWDTASTPRGGYAIYNNTIYNTGRNGIDFCVKEGLDGGTDRHTNAVWIPCEIAYNDCHDLGMFTDDGGMIYANGAVMGVDGQMSQLHHNYVYTTKAFDNAYNYGIYWDGNAHGCDTYNNLVFAKDEGGTISHNSINRHPTVETDSSASVWNNMQLGFVGVDAAGLSEYHFPEEKMFYAGTMDSERRNMNYARYKSGAADITNKAIDAVLSDGDMSVGSDGFVKYTESGQYVLFEDVDFGSGANEMELYLRGDRNWTLDNLKIYIGETKATATVYNTTVSIESYDTDETNTHSIVIHDTSGIQNVWVEATTLNSVRLGGISVWKHENPDRTDEYTLFRFLSTRDSEKKVSGGFMSYTYGGGGAWPIAYPVNKTISACSATYTDCVVTEPSRYFAMTASASGYDVGQLVKVYIDDETEPICTFTVTNNKSADIRVPNIVPFDNGRVLEPGTYDVKLVFDGYYTSADMEEDDSSSAEPIVPNADLIFDMDLSGCSTSAINVTDSSGSGKVSTITYGNGSTNAKPAYDVTAQGTPYLIFDEAGNTSAENSSVNVKLTDKTILDEDELSITAWIYDANSDARTGKYIFGFGTGRGSNPEWNALIRKASTVHLGVKIEGNSSTDGNGNNINLGTNQYNLGTWTDSYKNAWKHIAITKKWTYTDKTTGQGYYTITSYMDGVQIGSYNNKNTDTDTTKEKIRLKYSDSRTSAVLEIGGDGAGTSDVSFPGYIADFKLYDGLLTQAEIESQYNTTKNGFYDEEDSSDESTEGDGAEEEIKTYHKQSTVNYFGFLKDDDGISDIYVNKHEGGGITRSLSVSNSSKPFYILRGSSELSKKLILSNTLPNTTAAYENVLLVDDSLRFVARYSAEEGCAGQEVTVRVDDPSSEPIATFTTEETGAYKYKTARVNLTEAVPAGEHTVYISFGGEEDSGKTCRLIWFGFAKNSLTSGE